MGASLSISWIEINSGRQVPKVLGQIGNGSLRQGGEQAWDGHLGWVPGAVLLNSVFFSNVVCSECLICRVAYLLEMKEQVLEVSACLCSVVLTPRT